MVPEVQENTAFAELVARLESQYHEHRTPVERTPANMTSADGQEHSNGAHLGWPHTAHYVREVR